MNQIDLLKLGKVLWPDVYFYDKQREVVRSVCDNIETHVPAGNMLGKDYVTGFIVVAFFCSRHPCRIVTTSAKDDHLDVLWGEINQFIQNSATPLLIKDGGPLIVHNREIKKVVDGRECPISYVKGMVASQDRMAAMQGHHVANVGDGVPRTLFVCDESSSVPHAYYDMTKTWFDRMLSIGNPWPCNNFFYHAVHGRPGSKDHGGDIPSKTNGHYNRKIVHIAAEDSPNIRLGLAEERAGKPPSNRMLVPGVKSYERYVRERDEWDEIQLCVSHAGKFYEGAALKLVPRDWLIRANNLAEEWGVWANEELYMGVDPAEGGDSSAWTIVDRWGIIYHDSMKTPNTTDVTDHTITLLGDYGVDPENVAFDRGGGGKEHADYLRRGGYNVSTVAFGEAASSPQGYHRHAFISHTERREVAEAKTAYKNRRAEIYGLIRNLLNPSLNPSGFAISYKYGKIREQLEPIPLLRDAEGRLVLPPKDKLNKDSKEVTLRELLGCSPDETDSFGLAVFRMVVPVKEFVAGGV